MLHHFSTMFFNGITVYGGMLIFILLALGIVGLPIPDETIIVFSGVLIAQGKLPFLTTVAACLVGAMVGITISYLLGKSLGYSLLLKYGGRFGITDERIQKTHRWFEKIGKWSLLFGYFIFGVRHLIGYVAGTTRLDYLKFAIFAYSGALIWGTFFLSLGYFFAHDWQKILILIDQYLLLITFIILAMALFYLAYKMIFKKLKR